MLHVPVAFNCFGEELASCRIRVCGQFFRCATGHNGAAFIGAFLLWYLTVGPVRGFAYFLGISVIVDLAVAVMFTRPLILLLSRSPRFAQSTFFSMGADPTTSPAMSKKVAMR